MREKKLNISWQQGARLPQPRFKVESFLFSGGGLRTAWPRPPFPLPVRYILLPDTSGVTRTVTLIKDQTNKADGEKSYRLINLRLQGQCEPRLCSRALRQSVGPLGSRGNDGDQLFKKRSVLAFLENMGWRVKIKILLIAAGNQSVSKISYKPDWTLFFF